MRDTPLPAGRELDERIARDVMGWEVPDDTVLALIERSVIPHYSTDIAAAWQLIEHHPHYVYLQRSNDTGRFGFKDRMTWKCRFYAPRSFEVEADTAPHAICLAALAAIDGMDT